MTRLAGCFKCIAVVLLAAVLVTAGVACGGSNQAPTITSLVANPTNLAPGGGSTVTCVAADLDGDTLSYAWTCNGGAVSGTGAQVTWVAPSVANSYSVTVTVSDGKGGTVNSSVSIAVAVPTPTPTPAPTDGSIDIKSGSIDGAKVIIDGHDTSSVTPFVATHVAAGNHTVKLEYAHYKWRTENVSVTGGETTYLNWELTYADDVTLPIQPNASDGKDAEVDELSAGYNFATTNALTVDADSAGQRYRIYIQFDLSSIPATAVVTEANMGLYYCWNVLGAVAEPVGVYKVTGNWNESLLTWNNQPAVNATVQATVTIPASATGGFMNWAISGLVQNWVSGTVPNHGVMLRQTDDSTYGGRKEFYSSDWTETAMRPKLVITYYDPTP